MGAGNRGLFHREEGYEEEGVIGTIPTPHLLWLVWAPESNTESVGLPPFLCSFQFLMVWDVRTLPAFILQPSFGLCSCLPHLSRTFCYTPCGLEQTRCLL